MEKRFAIAWCFFLVAIFTVSGCTKPEITADKAVEIAKTVIIDSENSKITNYAAPETERLEIKENRKVFSENQKYVNLKGKKIWKVTFTTELDPLLGSINLYIDAVSGKVYGTDPRS